MTGLTARTDDRLTLETLLNDPVTQAVMRSDHITQADTEAVFLRARRELEARRSSQLRTWNAHLASPYHLA